MTAESHYPCEACGADLRFAPGQTRLVCDHCGHVQDIPGAIHRGQRTLRELDLESALRADLPEAELEDLRLSFLIHDVSRMRRTAASSPTKIASPIR